MYVDGGVVRMDMSEGMSCVWRVACLWCVNVDLVVRGLYVGGCGLVKGSGCVLRVRV